MSVSSPLCLESNRFSFEHQLRPQHYLIKVFKMLKCPLLSILPALVLCCIMMVCVHSSPINLHTARDIGSYDDELRTDSLYAALPSPPVAREERETQDTSPTSLGQPAPRKLPFIKNSQCTLHIPGGETRPKMCGLRQLDVAYGESGIKSWKPGRCRPYHCSCVATKEVHRAKRTIADNKTTLDFHRFRVFECV